MTSEIETGADMPTVGRISTLPSIRGYGQAWVSAAVSDFGRVPQGIFARLDFQSRNYLPKLPIYLDSRLRKHCWAAHTHGRRLSLQAGIIQPAHSMLQECVKAQLNQVAPVKRLEEMKASALESAVEPLHATV